MAKVTYVHFGAGETEIGIQFTADDGAGGTVTGRAFAPADASLKAAVVEAAQAALDALTGELPADYPPGAVTTALMKKRTAEAEAKKSRAAQQAAEAAKVAAESAKGALDEQIAAKQAAIAALDAEIAAKVEVVP